MRDWKHLSDIIESHANPNPNPNPDILIREAFWGFEETLETSAGALETKILDNITGNGFDLSKCRGQGYDGAANMSGVYSGVQARIKEMEPLAKYVHWAAHNLNLALNDSVKDNTEMGNFYDTIVAERTERTSPRSKGALKPLRKSGEYDVSSPKFEQGV